MDESPHVVNDREVTTEEQQYALELGVIGHEGVDEAYRIGKDGGPIIACVQLFRGRDVTQSLKADRMQGVQILARVRSGVSGLPPKGTEVLVGFPGGMSTSAGAGVIVAELSRVDSVATYGNLSEEELCIHPGNADATSRILMKKNNSVSIFTKDSSGASMAVIVDAATGDITLLSKHGAISLSSSGISLLAGQGGMQIGSDGKVSINCVDFTVNGMKAALSCGTVLLGVTAIPNPVQSAVYGPIGLIGIGSTSVFVGI